MQIVAPEKEDDYTLYFLDNPRRAHRIEVFVLKQYLRKFHGYAQLEFFLLLPENKENHFPQVSPTSNDFCANRMIGI